MKKTRKIFLSVIVVCILVTLTGCSWFQSKIKEIKGDLIGNEFKVEIYDNYANNLLNMEGEKVNLSSNIVETKGVDSNGTLTTNYEMSSVITITIDGHEVGQTGNSVLFIEEGLNKAEIELPKTTVQTNGGTINIVDENLNKIKNMMGKSRAIIICSQLGVPIAAFEGDDIYYEIPDDLPKTTKIIVDGKALYVHRVNYILVDKEII